MKIKPLIIKFQPIKDFASGSQAKLKNITKNKGKTTSFVQPQNHLIWDSVESYQRYMSDQKYAILATIYKHKPQSIYQLAKLLERAQPNVARDCDSLSGHGFIFFEESGSNRGGLIPRLSFDYNAIVVELPSVKYKIEFEEAAA